MIGQCCFYSGILECPSCFPSNEYADLLTTEVCSAALTDRGEMHCGIPGCAESKQVMSDAYLIGRVAQVHV